MRRRLLAATGALLVSATAALACSGPDITVATVAETCSNNDGSATVSALTGTAPFTYQWDGFAGAQATPTATGLAAGTYSVTVTDAAGCSATEVAVVASSDPSVQSCQLATWSCGTALPSMNSYLYCNTVSGASRYMFRFLDEATGTVIVGFNHPYYGSSGFFAPVWAQGLQYNTVYKVQVRGKVNGCWGPYGAACEVTMPVVVPTTKLSVADCGSQLASVNDYFTIDPVGNAERYQYEISDGSTVIASPLSLSSYPTATWFSLYYVSGIQCATTYNIRVRAKIMGVWGSWGPACQVTTAANDPVLSGLSVVGTTINDQTCEGADGSAVLNVAGGNGQLNYVWDSGAGGQTDALATGLAAGTYSATVTDAIGCEVVQSTTIGVAVPPAITMVETHESCFPGNDGSLAALLSGGTAPFTFNWNDGQVGQVASGLNAGTYSVTVIDGNGCSSVEQGAVNYQPLALVSSTNPETCVPGSNGTASVSPTSGLAPFTYAWNSTAAGQTSNTATGLSKGNYTVTVVDAVGCTQVQSIVVGGQDRAQVSAAATSPLCYASNDGAIDISVSGGVAPYTYAWTGGASTEDVAGIPHGTYNVVVTDINGCTALGPGFVADEVSRWRANGDTQDAALSNHAQLLYGAGFGAGYCGDGFLFDGTNDVVTVANHTSLAVGQQFTYALWFKADNVNALDPLTGNARQVLLQFGSKDANGATNNLAIGNGTASLGVYGFGPGYTDLAGTTAINSGEWNHMAVTYDGTLAKLYLNGALQDMANVSINMASDCGLRIGGWKHPQSGNEHYPFGGAIDEVRVIARAVSAMELQDMMAQSCLGVNSITLSAPPALGISATVQDETCEGTSDGTITVASVGGVAPHSFSWNDGSSDANRIDLGAGAYSVTLTDANGCTQEHSETINADPAPVLPASTQPESCAPGADGALTVLYSGGTAPYTYAWQDGATGDSRTGLTAGTYTVTFSDASGCSAVTQFTVPEAPAVVLDMETTNAICEWGDGSATASPISGTAPFTYSWDAAAGNQTAAEILDVTAGTYAVTVVDGAGCTTSAVTTVGITCVPAYTATRIDGGWDHSLMVCSDGSIFSSGDNVYGQLGNGTSGANLNSTVPLAVPGLDLIKAVATGQEHSVAMRYDGTVWTWGLNTVGQLGDGTTTMRTSPVQVQGITNIVAVAAGAYHTVALQDNGRVWAWGNNGSGQLGDGTTAQSTIPVQVQGLTDVIAIAAGGGHSLAVKTDGTVWAWGSNGVGQLGNGTTQNQSTPVQAIVIDKVKAIAAGSLHTLAVRGDGTLWAWGNNSSGQLGDGMYNFRSEPYQVPINPSSHVVSIAAGNSNSRALRADGSVYSWGSTYSGAGGPIPTLENTLVGVEQIAAGDQFLIALKDNGDVVGFGYNGNGPLGIGNTTSNYPTLATASVGCSMLPECNTFAVAALDVQDEMCFGANNGSAEASAVGGIAPYKVLWQGSSNPIEANPVMALEPGNYTATITDFQGCEITANFVVGAGNPVAQTELASVSCGVTLPTINSYIHSVGVAGATRYEYLFEDANGFAASALSLSQYPSATFFSPYYVAGLQPGETYQVSVRAKVNGCWGEYGNSCSVTLPNSIPEVQLANPYCGGTLSSMSQYFYNTGAGVATRYQYEITDGNGFYEVVASPYSNPTATWFAMVFVPGIQPGTTYNVRVQAKIGGVWGDFGPSCTITTPGVANKANVALVSDDSMVLEAVLHPNPTAGSSMLSFSAPLSETANLGVFDLSGRLVESRTLKGGTASVELNQAQTLVAGVYLVQVATSTQVVQSRMVVR